ncbi:MAG: TolC family protein [Bacteroidales bacterium]|nr:TolC family protein [Bacteroidales bacterium]
MKNSFLIKTFLFIILPFAGFSQQDSIISLNLEDAQEYAIENNLNLKNARLDVDAAEKKVWETTAIGLPQVNGTLNYQHIPGDLPTFDFGADSSTMELYNYIFASLNMLADDAGVTLPQMPDMESDGEPLTLGVKNSTTYSVTVSQLVFSGEYLVGLQASKTYLQISELSMNKQEIDLKADVLNSYISILILEKNLNIIESSVENLESLVNETKKMYEQGFMESTDADQLQITLNTLINARNTIQRQIDVSYMLFKITLGANLNSNIELSQNISSVYDQIITKKVNEDFDISNNINFKMIENQVKISELSFKREKTKYLPTISAFYNYQDKTNKASFDFTINHIIGVNLDVPIFSSFQRNAQVQQAKIEYQKSINNQILLENNLKTQAQLLRYNFINALEKYKVTQQNVDLSKNVFENTSKKYKQGMVSSMELTQANNTYLQAESDNTNALLGLLQTKIELEKILNEL